jgi:hypothetical protein
MNKGRPISLFLAVFVAGVGSVRAETPRFPQPPLQEVTVVAPRDPKVVATYPAVDAVIPSGTAVLKIVFDQPMTPEAWSYVQSKSAAFPDCLARPRLLPDRRTFVLLCSLASQQTYALEIDGAPGFVSTARRSAPPYLLRFKTSAEMTLGLHDALQQAALTDGDDPIMDWNGASGVSSVQAPPPSPPS